MAMALSTIIAARGVAAAGSETTTAVRHIAATIMQQDVSAASSVTTGWVVAAQEVGRNRNKPLPSTSLLLLAAVGKIVATFLLEIAT